MKKNRQTISDNEHIFPFVNKGFSNYLEINECERRHDLHQTKNMLHKKKMCRESPQIISNYSLMRLFNAVTFEHIYGIVIKRSQMVT